MRALFTKLDGQRHRLDVIRPDGRREGRELETRSYLVHDLAHYAVEAAAGIDDGLWGTLASGVTLDELAARSRSPSPGLVRAEQLAGPFQSLWNGRFDRALYFEMTGADEAFTARALERMRRLMGHWKATPWRGVMELPWPAA